MVTVEELKENFVTREVKPYGTCVCIPNKEFKPEWENELRSQGFKVFGAFLDQAPFMLVQLKPAKFSDEKRRWSKEDDEKLVDLWNKGLGVNEIAAKFSDRSIHSVKMRIGRLKVKGVIHSRWQKRYRKHPPERTDPLGKRLRPNSTSNLPGCRLPNKRNKRIRSLKPRVSAESRHNRRKRLPQYSVHPQSSNHKNNGD